MEKINYLPDGYYVTKDGKFLNKNNKILKTQISNSGYVCINIKNKGYFLHRALCCEYVKQIDGKNYVNHKDGNKLNNSIDNLEWVTKGENLKHAYNKGLKKSMPLHYKGKFGSEHNRSKKVIRLDTKEEFCSMTEASKKLGISVSSVSWSIKHKKPIFGMHFEVKQ